jgi:hypothetical protein
MIGQKIQNALFRIRAAFDRDSAKFELRIERDWALAMISFAALMFAVLAWSWYVYASVGREEMPLLGAGATSEEVTREKLQTIAAYLSEKEADYQYLRAHRPSVADPSR